MIRSILSLVLLSFVLVTTTGCFGKSERAIVNKSGRTRHDNRLPDVSSQSDTRSDRSQTQTQDNNGWISIDLADDSDNNSPITDVAEDFIDDSLNGDLQDIQILFENETLTVVLWDNQSVTDNHSPFQVFLDFDGSDDNGYSFSDFSGIVDFDVVEDLGSDQYTFRVSFENSDGSAGILGYVSLYSCEIEDNC